MITNPGIQRVSLPKRHQFRDCYLTISLQTLVHSQPELLNNSGYRWGTEPTVVLIQKEDITMQASVPDYQIS